MDRVEYIKIRNHGARDGTRVGALELLVWRRDRTGFYDDRPWELVRSENELIRGRGGGVASGLGKGMGRNWRMCCAIQNGSS